MKKESDTPIHVEDLKNVNVNFGYVTDCQILIMNMMGF